VALLEKRGFLYNHSGDFPQVILIVPSHVPNTYVEIIVVSPYMFFPNFTGGAIITWIQITWTTWESHREETTTTCLLNFPTIKNCTYCTIVR
jgi:hypothetical protein